ncbi:MAG: hypothetical protein MJ188_12215 [Treponema sp.]|nr:hypothetical protein [Treponema sp.]
MPNNSDLEYEKHMEKIKQASVYEETLKKDLKTAMRNLFTVSKKHPESLFSFVKNLLVEEVGSEENFIWSFMSGYDYKLGCEKIENHAFNLVDEYNILKGICTVLHINNDLDKINVDSLEYGRPNFKISEMRDNINLFYDMKWKLTDDIKTIFTVEDFEDDVLYQLLEIIESFFVRDYSDELNGMEYFDLANTLLSLLPLSIKNDVLKIG